MNLSTSLRAFLVIAAAAAFPRTLAADTVTTSAAPAPPPGRVVIRGSGNNVRLERETTPPVQHRQFASSRNALLEDLVRMSKGGVADPLLITYLKTHAREVPKVLSQEDLTWLQKGGVSDSVVTYLARASAVDIGLTGEGRGAPEYAAGAGPYGFGPSSLYTDDYGNEYPGSYPTYGAGYLPVRRFFHQMPRPVHPIVHPRPGMGPPRPMGTPTFGAISRNPRQPGSGF